MREKNEDSKPESLAVYESHPPGWLSKIHNTANLGEKLERHTFSSPR